MTGARHDRHRYRFHSRWHVASPPEAVYAVLARGEDFPRWWPQVREVAVTGPGAGRCRLRSLLPFDLWVTVHATREDRDAGVLEAALDGDLHGWVRWTVTPGGTGSDVTYEQDTELCGPLLRRLPSALRPVLRANHAWMMRAGRRGLRAAARSSAGGRRPHRFG